MSPQGKRSLTAVVAVVVLLVAALAVNRLTAHHADAGTSPNRAALIAKAALPDCPATTGTNTVSGGLPGLTLPCLGNGPKVDLAKLRGPALVNIWAGTCPPCRAEGPQLAAFAKAASGKVTVLGVVDGAYTGETWDDALDASRGLGLHYASLFDAHGKLVEWVRSGGIPVSLFVDKDGKVVHTKIGPLTSAELAGLAKQYFGIQVSAGNPA